MAECQVRNLPLNEGKSVIRRLNTAILGGEVDGVSGVLRHSRNKSAKLACRSLALLSMDEVGQAAVQHWAGMTCFALGFQRPFFFLPAGHFPFHWFI